MTVVISGNSGIVNVQGSAGSPAESTSGGSNTGLYFPTTTSVALAANGVAAMLITANGNVGIGTSTPSYRLQLTSSANTNDGIGYTNSNTGTIAQAVLTLNTSGATGIQIGQNYTSKNGFIYLGDNAALGFSTNATLQMTIAANGNVGIGTATPLQNLTVYNASSANMLLQGNTTQWVTFSYSGFAVSGTVSNTPWLFYTNNSEQMRIDSSGNLGIGTSSPGGKLDVHGYVQLGNYGGTYQGLDIQNNNDSSVAETVSFIDAKNNLGTADSNIFMTHETDGSTNITFGNTPSGSRSTDRRREAMRIAGNGNVGIATLSPTNARLVIDTASNLTNISKIAINGYAGGLGYGIIFTPVNDSSPVPIIFNNSSGSGVGSVSTTSTSTFFNTSSDYRLKTNVQPMTTGLATISQLKPVTYDWISDKSKGEGFIAHELQAMIPHAVTGEKDDVDENGKIRPQGVDYSKVVVHLVAAIQELSAKLAALEAKVGA